MVQAVLVALSLSSTIRVLNRTLQAHRVRVDGELLTNTCCETVLVRLGENDASECSISPRESLSCQACRKYL